MVAADLRNNGRTDLLIGEFGGMGVAVLLGNGNGTYQKAVVYQAGTPLGVAIGDMNGDGIPDIVAATLSKNAESGLVDVLLGNGDGTFKSAISYPSGKFPEAIAIADFNGDNLPDVTVSDQIGDVEIVLLNTGTVHFSPTSPLNFKKQAVGTTSPAQKVTLTNSGKTALNISAMKVAGQFAMTSTCSKAVVPNKSCTISVTFSPKSQGAKSGTITINDSASSKPQVIELSGTGT
jgi:archaellum component FlaF (FlaF/FlaG flagellin family)